MNIQRVELEQSNKLSQAIQPNILNKLEKPHYVTQAQPRQVHIGGLAALRVIALLAVVAYHLRPDVFVGGYLAVDLFFIISAYLTTTKLLENWRQISLTKLYARRFIKLWLPLFALCTFVLFIAFLFVPKLLLNMLPNYLSSISFTNNFWQIHLGDSYFAEAISPSAFKHLWYIAILGQFTLLWPAIFKIVARKNKLRSKLRQQLSLGMFLVIAISVISMFILYKPNTDPTHVYYGTLTRAYAYAVGALLGLLVPVERLQDLAPKLSKAKKQICFSDVFIVPLLCLILVIWMLLPANNNFVYQGALLGHAILCALLVLLVIVPGSFINALFDLPILQVIAKRSYEYYLWQYAVMIILREKSSTLALDRNIMLVLNILLTLALAEIAYRFVKQLSFKRFIKEIKLGQIQLRSLANLFVVLVFVLAIVPALANSKPVSSEENAAFREQIRQAAKQAEADKQANAVKESKQATQVTGSAQQKNKDDVAPTEANSNPKQIDLQTKDKGPYDLKTMLAMTKEDLTDSEQQKIENIKVTAVGDSLLLGCTRELMRLLPEFRFRAKESEQVDKAVQDLKNLQEQDLLGDVILLSVGQNGYFTKEQAEQLLKIADGRPVFAFTIFVSKEWEGANNKLWYELAENNNNLEIVDWHTFAKNNQNLLWDGIHPNVEGQKAYARLFARTLLRRLA